ncbi:hypothetical protein LPJ53_001996 [Coemansia erecta]|uniref:Ornithine decarboxylase antizyme n=1 Tax=Coemansia erecta TaxID=147472 RepID=A0A9W7Y473_9FUNG|nr:hypothetical protein LPJ53_001996 [Coemansia erecta]
MMLFTLANNDSPVSSDALSSVDDSKPNSIYGGSVQPAATTSSLFHLHDLPGGSSLDSSMTEVFGDSLLDDTLDDSPPSSGEYEESLYMLENATAAAHNLFPAECCVERVSGIISPWVRNSGGVFDGSWDRAEPGGGGSTVGGGRAGRAPGYVARVPVSRQSSRSSSNSDSSSSSDNDGELMTPAAPCLLREEFSLRMAADVQHEVFPHGIPSQGVIKSGPACISASVLFRATSCSPSVPWEGFIIDDVLFVRVPVFAASGAHFRSAVMALIELAEDVLGCASIMIAVPKSLTGTSSSSSVDSSSSSAAAAASLVRAFMYSGFELVSPMLYQPSDAYVLLGYDAM